MGFEPVQVPPWQESVCVQAFPSLHPAVLLMYTQIAIGVPAFTQTSSVQGLLSSQSEAALQIVYSHVSP
jgi:hypothetical protein